MFEMEAATHLPMCDQCGKRFQRKAHLIRHQQQRMFTIFSRREA
jgi:hypothetical protein